MRPHPESLYIIGGAPFTRINYTVREQTEEDEAYDEEKLTVTTKSYHSKRLQPSLRLLL